MAQNTHYEYADGSANRYVITPAQLEYIPVKPEESSTGMYSGGDPKTIALNDEQFNLISALLEDAINMPSIHIEDRMKTSGMIMKIEGSKRTHYILKPKSDAMLKIENELKALLGK